MKSCECKTITHADGRKGYCLSSRPRNKQLRVMVDGKEELWGAKDVPVVELARLMGVRVE